MGLVRISACFFILFCSAGYSYSEAVYHLKEWAIFDTNSVDVRDLVREELPDGIRFPLTTGRSYSNMEVCGMLNLLGLKDYILVGNTVVLTRISAADRTTDEPAISPLLPSGTDLPVPQERFYLKVADRATGDLIFQKGNISIVSRVRIVRNDRDGYLVQNTFSGKKFKVPQAAETNRSER